MSYKLTDNTRRIVVDKKVNISLALRFIAEDIKKTAEPNTPKLTGDLRDSTVITINGHRGKIIWNKSYAQYQERGYTSGPVRRYTTPGTGAHFAENAVMRVVRHAGNHFRKARVIK